ncbi:hypothetical protein [Chlorogloeopsis sp. ULAP02]
MYIKLEFIQCLLPSGKISFSEDFKYIARTQIELRSLSIRFRSAYEL